MTMTRTIVYDHRGRTAKGCPGPLEVRITIDRKAYYVSTGIKVLRKEWKFGEVIDRPDSKELNERLGIMLRTVDESVNAMLTAGRSIDVSQLKNALWGKKSPQNENVGSPFIDWFAETYVTLHLSPGVLSHYRTVLKRLRACAIFNKWTDISVENVYKFDAFLHGLSAPRNDAEIKMGKGVEKLSDGAVHNHHKILKAMIARAYKMGLCPSNPYDRLRGVFKRGDKETVTYLTEEEVAAFEAQHPIAGSSMAVSRDLFVFQLYTGLAYGDTQVFDISNYKKVNGRWVNVGTRIKTGVPYVSQLLPPAVEVLEKYGMQLPKIENRVYNLCLKALGVAAGIATPLHSHMARHTFATWMLRNGAKIENVSRMLGHTNITQTQRYAKVLAESVHDDFDKMEKLLANKKKDEKATSNGSGSPDADIL